MKQPENLNAMYLLANQWVKPKTYAPGLAATFATTSLDQQESSEKSRKNANNKKKGKQAREPKKPEKPEPTRRDTSEVVCYGCGLTGHYSTRCPYKMDKSKSKAESDDEDEESASGHVTWADTRDYCTFTTYQVNSVSDNRFKPTKILIDNQANVSIVHPDLARNIMALVAINSQ